MTDEDYITTEEAAQLSQFHVEHIRELARDKKVHSRKWGRSWMISRISLLEYLASDRKPGPKSRTAEETDSNSNKGLGTTKST